MNFTLLTLALAAGLFFGMLALLEIGRHVGARLLGRDPDGARAGVGAMEGAVFGLLGLLAAFTFSGAASRFDARRHLIVEETNAIGTAYLRLDLLPPGRRDPLRDDFRRYLDSRLAVYQKMPDIAAAQAELAKSNVLQTEIWTRAVAACRAESSPAVGMLLLPALNAMIDITTTRTMAAKTHPPMVIFLMLGALMLVGALLAGVDMAGSKTRSWVHILGFAAILAATMFVIVDLEYPRLGLIHVADFDQALIDLRQSMR